MGTTPTEAFFVMCDATTTTQNDIDNGIVSCAVAFAPAQPAEFVMLNIRLTAALP